VTISFCHQKKTGLTRLSVLRNLVTSMPPATPSTSGDPAAGSAYRAPCSTWPSRRASAGRRCRYCPPFAGSACAAAAATTSASAAMGCAAWQAAAAVAQKVAQAERPSACASCGYRSIQNQI